MRKKGFSFFLTIAMIISLFGGLSTTASATTGLWTDGITANASAMYSGGDGTQGTPYLLASAEDLAQLVVNVAAGTTYDNKYFLLTQDVDLSGKYWVPIGYNGAAFGVRVFQGTFDGNGHVVKNVVMDQNAVSGILEGDSFGFFNRLYEAAVRNFGIENGSVLLSTSKTHIGMLIGYSSSTTVESCFATGSVSANEGGTNVGGLIGTSRYSESAVTDCFFIGSVSGTSITNTGGLVGLLADGSHNPQNCYAAATVTVTGTRVYPLASAAANGYYDSTLGPAAAGGGTGKTTAEMKTADTAALLNNSVGTAWGYDAGKNSGYPYLYPNTSHILIAPSAQTQNGVTAAITFSPAVGDVTATVTLTGTAAAAGTHTVDLTSTKAGLTSNPQTVTVTAGQDLTAVPVSKTFSFTMPAENVDDFILTHTFEAADATNPVLTGTSVWRSAGDTATVRFMSDEAGTCWYQITDCSAPPADVVTGGTNGGTVIANTTVSVSLTGLTAGAKYVHLVVADASGNTSAPLTISLPCDYYYYEDFESYPLDTYITSGELSPISQLNEGTGSENQKVVQNLTGASSKMLSLSSTDWASDQYISLDGSVLAAAANYVLEGDVYPQDVSGWNLRFTFNNGSYSARDEAGIFFNGGLITTAAAGGTTLGTYTSGHWYHLKIIVTPSTGYFAVYVDGGLKNDELTLPTGICRIALSSGHNKTTYLDNIKFYAASTAERHTVTFSMNSGISPVETYYYIASGSSDFYDSATGGNIHTLTVPTRPCYTFGGWYKEAACTNQIIDTSLALCASTDYTDASANWTKTDPVTLYAKWLEETPSGLDFDYENEMITGLTAGAEYTIGGIAVTADAYGKTEIQSGWFGTALSVVKKGSSSDYSFDSQAATLNVAARPATPSGLSGIDETYPGAGDGQIISVDDTMEYRLSTASDWVSVAAETTEITGLDDGTYYVRYEAVTSGSTAFASAYIAVAVGTTGATPETQPSAAADYPNEKLTGLTASSVYDIGGTEYTADVSGEIAIQDEWFGTTINIAKKGNGTTTTNSTAQNLELAARPAAPDASEFTVTQPTASVSTGTIAGITSSMGYSTDGGTSWTAGNGSVVAGLAPGEVLVRVTATASAPKSGSLTITITAYQAPGGSTSGGGTNTNEDEAESIEIISEDGSTLATGTVTEIENGVGISISSNQVDLLAGSGQSVMFEADTVSVSFDTAAVDYIDVAAGSDDVELTIVRVEPSNLSEENRQLIGDRPVYEFSLTAGETAISDFGGGTAAVVIPYTLGSDEDPNAVVVYYIDGSGNLLPVTGRYDAETGTVEFTAEHFSVYAVGYNYIGFSDVGDTAWYYDAVTFCAARGITDGTGDGNFSPDAKLTRGQFIVLLMRAYGIEADEDINDNFDDAGDTYYTAYLATAKSLGITSGVGNNLYAPEREITRQDMFTLLYRALEVLGELPETDGTASLSNFTDADEISDYAEKAMESLVAAGIISGSDGKLDPSGGSTRAQMAQVLYNILFK